MIRRLLVLCTIGILLAGCGGSSSKPDRSVTVVLDWTPNTNHSGLYMALERGIYADAGLDVEIVEPDQAGGLTQLAAGNAQFAYSYAEQLLPARAAGAPVVSVAAVLRTNTSSLVSPADRQILRPRDLAGKVFGTYGGPLEEPLVKALVRCDGGDPDTVRFVDVGNAAYDVGFRKRGYDAVWVFDGWDVIRLRDVAKLAVTTIPFREHLDCIPDWYTPVLATSERLMNDEPELVRAFLRATAAGYDLAASDPAAAAQVLLAAVPESDRQLVEASSTFLAEYFQASDGSWGVQDPAVWDRFNAFLVDNDVLSNAGPVDDAFTNAFLPTR